MTGSVYHAIEDWYRQDDEPVFDVIDVLIKLGAAPDLQPLDEMLDPAGSVYTATERGIERRVDATAKAAFDAISQPRDTASVELAKAWSRAYGRDPDASHAWYHAIKAVEAIFVPLVVPNNPKGRIGHAVGELANNGARWTMQLRFNHYEDDELPRTAPFTPGEALVGMLRLIYPNPDRHRVKRHRTPTLEEARAVVQLAVAIVQWGRDGQIVRGDHQDTTTTMPGPPLPPAPELLPLTDAPPPPPPRRNCHLGRRCLPRPTYYRRHRRRQEAATAELVAAFGAAPPLLQPAAPALPPVRDARY
jgi:hypothetical protein